MVAIKNVNSERERLHHQHRMVDDDDDEDSDANAGFGCAGNAFGYQTLNNRQAEFGLRCITDQKRKAEILKQQVPAAVP